MKLFSKQSGLILLRWAAVAAALHLAIGALNLQATPEHPVTMTGIVIGWIALVFFSPRSITCLRGDGAARWGGSALLWRQ